MSQIIFMKKTFKSLLAIVIMLILALISLSTVSAANEKKSVYSYLTQNLGLSNAAACGILANIEKESNFDPTCVGRDSNGLLSGGLCQWNGSRFSSLKNYCSKNGYNYLSVKGQLSYLYYELHMNYYKHIYNYLKNVPNTAQGAYDAAHYWCYYFEIPASRATKAVSRGNLAKNTYWKKYSSNAIENVKLTCADNKKTVDLSDSTKISWNNAGKAVKSYTVYLAKIKNGKADFKSAKKIKLSRDTHSYKFNLSKLGKGKYSVYVMANASKTSESVKSNNITFTAKCLDHSYTSEIIKKATAEASGLRVYTCKNCKETIKKTISSKAQAAVPSIKTVKVTSTEKDKIAISLKFSKKVSGYECFIYNGKKWQKVNCLPSSRNEVTFAGLSSGKVYKLKFRAFYDSKDKTSYSAYKTVSAATVTEDVRITSISRPSKGSVGLSWEKVPGADSYEVFAASSLDGKYKKVKTLGKTASSCKISGLNSAKKYFFKIRTVNESKNSKAYSPFSNIKYAVAL